MIFISLLVSLSQLSVVPGDGDGGKLDMLL